MKNSNRAFSYYHKTINLFTILSVNNGTLNFQKKKKNLKVILYSTYMVHDLRSSYQFQNKTSSRFQNIQRSFTSKIRIVISKIPENKCDSIRYQTDFLRE